MVYHTISPCAFVRKSGIPPSLPYFHFWGKWINMMIMHWSFGSWLSWLFSDKPIPQKHIPKQLNPHFVNIDPAIFKAWKSCFHSTWAIFRVHVNLGVDDSLTEASLAVRCWLNSRKLAAKHSQAPGVTFGVKHGQTWSFFWDLTSIDHLWYYSILMWTTTRYGMALIHADIWMIWRLGFLNMVSLYSEAVDAIYIYLGE